MPRSLRPVGALLRAAGLIVAALLLLRADPATAFGPLNGPFALAPNGAGSQRAPRVAANSAGQAVAVWQENINASSTVYARRFLAGAPVGEPFTVHNPRIGTEYLPEVAVWPDGSFVVVWTQNILGKSTILARVFDSEGAPRGEPFPLTFNDTGHVSYPRVAIASPISFVATWTTMTVDWDDLDVAARRFHISGVGLSGEVRVNSGTADAQYNHDLVVGPDGVWTVVWVSNSSLGRYNSIMLRHFALTGTPLTGDLRVHDHEEVDNWEPAIAADATGAFAVVWTRNGMTGNGGGSSDPIDVYIRRYDPSGAPLGDPQQAPLSSSGMQHQPNIAIGPDGSALVTWRFIPNLTTPAQLQGRYFPAGGATPSASFLVDGGAQYLTWLPDAAIDGDGRMLVLWERRQSERDTIYARQYRVNLPPTLSQPADLVLDPGSSASVGFTVHDQETPGQLLVTVAGDNPTLLPAGSLSLAGSGSNRTLTVAPASGQTGSATITITARDDTQAASVSFRLAVGQNLPAPDPTPGPPPEPDPVPEPDPTPSPEPAPTSGLNNRVYLPVIVRP